MKLSIPEVIVIRECLRKCPDPELRQLYAREFADLDIKTSTILEKEFDK